MEVCRRSSGLLLLLGLSLLASTLQGVQGEVESEGPSESECRPYIEKALKELETGEPKGSSEVGESGEDLPTVEITTDDPERQVESDENNDTDEDGNDAENENPPNDNTSEQENATGSTEAAEDDQENDNKEDDSNEQQDQPADDDKQSEETTDDQPSKEESKEEAEGQKDSVEQGDDPDTNENDSEEKAESKENEQSGEVKEDADTNEDTNEVDGDSKEAKSHEGPESKEDEADTKEDDSKEGVQGDSVEEQATQATENDSNEDQVDSKGDDKDDSKDEDDNDDSKTDGAKDDHDSKVDVDKDDDDSKADDNDSKADDNDSKDDDNDSKVDDNDSKADDNDSRADDNDSKADDNDSKADDNDSKVDDNDSKADEDDQIGEDDDSKADEANKADEEDSKEEAKGTDAKSEEGQSVENDAKSAEGDDAEKEAGEASKEESKEGKEGETGEDDDDRSREKRSVEDGDVPEEELSVDTEVPTDLRPRDHVEKLLKLDDESAETEKIINKVAEVTLKELKKLYENAIKPLEVLYKYRDLSNRHFGDAEIFSKPLILFMGPWSGGKSSIINYLVNNEYNETSLRTGAEPSPAYFNILMYGEEPEIIDGTELAADFTFSGLQKFGQGLEERLRGVKLPNKLLEKVNVVEIPGILEVRKQVSRVFPFNDACQWFIDRADIIFLVYDPSKLDVGPETEAILDQLKGREPQTRIILNKADQVKPEELMRVQGALIWNISPLMSSPQPPTMYTTSLWSRPYEPWAPVRLLQAQERAFLRDLRGAIDKRIENKIASARRFAVRVRNHAKMVDCYLTTYYNHKSVFGNRKQVADEIIEHPQDYHIYEGLSTLTNISRYDLPDPEVYKDFFKLNPLYDFQQLSATCTYFRGCPINRLDVAIAYDLPELVGTHKKLVENALAEAESQSTAAPGS